MSDDRPLLDVVAALPEPGVSLLPPTPIDLRVMPGDGVLIESSDPSQTAAFADLCCGLVPLRKGFVRFLGHVWTDASYERASALRGRIGQVSSAGSWISFLPADANILVQQLHHTRLPESVLRDRAAELSQSFGLPGLPLSPPNELSFEDLLRAACVRAFIGEPRLIILKSPELERAAGLKSGLVNALFAARTRGAASIWITSSDFILNDWTLPANKRLRLTDHGLVSTRTRSERFAAH